MAAVAENAIMKLPLAICEPHFATAFCEREIPIHGRNSTEHC
jgi:hypothetical protein